MSRTVVGRPLATRWRMPSAVRRRVPARQSTPATTLRSAANTPPRPAAAAELGMITWVPIGALGSLLLLSVAFPSVADGIALPLAIAGAALGVPHGAVDHILPRWSGWMAQAGQTARRAGRRPLDVRVVAGALTTAYLTVAVLATLALLIAPAVAVVSFLILSALHFGTAETAFATERCGRPTPPPWRRPLASATHGVAVVGLLLWAHPAQSDPWLRLLSPGAADAAAEVRTPGLWVTGLLLGWQAVASLSAAARRLPCRGDRGRAELLTLLELALLTAAFLTAPPLAAFGVYFGCWHAVRHTGRLLDLARDPGDDGWRPAGRRLLRASVLPAAIALGVMAGLILAGERAPLVVEVAILLALTYPHSAAVWWTDLSRTRSPSPGTSARDQASAR